MKFPSHLREGRWYTRFFAPAQKKKKKCFSNSVWLVWGNTFSYSPSRWMVLSATTLTTVLVYLQSNFKRQWSLEFSVCCLFLQWELFLLSKRTEKKKITIVSNCESTWWIRENTVYKVKIPSGLLEQAQWCSAGNQQVPFRIDCALEGVIFRVVYKNAWPCKYSYMLFNILDSK